MTYWVIAHFKDTNTIYMAADFRVSCEAESAFANNTGIYNYSDISEKLFHISYKNVQEKYIKIGICTSGYASNGVGWPTIAEIIKNFLIMLEKCSFAVIDAKCLAESLIFYIKNNYTDTKIYNGQPIIIGEHIVQNTCFGIGMFINEKPYIASYNPYSPNKFTNHLTGYIESSFTTRCLDTICGNSIWGNDLLTKLEIATIDKTGEDFVRNIIFVAASGEYKKKCAQTISKESDFVEITKDKLICNIKVKTNVNMGDFIKPITYGSDRESISTAVFGVPPDKTDTHTTLRIGLSTKGSYF